MRARRLLAAYSGLALLACGILSIARAEDPFAEPPARIIIPDLLDDSLLELDEIDEYDRLLERLETAEQRIGELQQELARAVERLPPERPVVEPQPVVESPAGQPPAPLKWYEKIGLRGYTQVRYNWITHVADGSARPQYAGDASVSDDASFLIRRARLIFFGDITDHLYIYLQPDFAVTPPGSPDAIQFLQLRDWYADVHLDKKKVYRFRVGQSKVPYGWENLQSSMNRVPLDRNDAFNSAVRNERDLGAFFYWTPEWTQQIFKEITDKNLKHSGNYGLFGIGGYNGQGGSFSELNDSLHLVARITWPFCIGNGQYVELGMQGYTGQYVVLGSPIRPLGAGTADIIPAGTRQTGNLDGHLDQRLGWTLVYYPQPLGFQAEWTIGRGPALNDEQTAIERRFLNGGYAMILYNIEDFYGTWFPFVRWQYFEGGYRSFRNAPFSSINEWELGFEWQFRPEMELTLSYVLTDRTNLTPITSTAPVSQESYRQFVGQFLRMQFQFNY